MVPLNPQKGPREVTQTRLPCCKTCFPCAVKCSRDALLARDAASGWFMFLLLSQEVMSEKDSFLCLFKSRALLYTFPRAGHPCQRSQTVSNVPETEPFYIPPPHHDTLFGHERRNESEDHEQRTRASTYRAESRHCCLRHVAFSPPREARDVSRQSRIPDSSTPST